MRRSVAASQITAAVIALTLAAAPATAWGHAALESESPSASAVARHAPRVVSLTFSEAVEPRFAVISVTDAKGRQLARGAPRRSSTDRQTIERVVDRLRSGWYLVYWRVISADGHPVRGAFTFAVGPGPGTPVAFTAPSLRETAATPGLLLARWAVFLSVMAAIGLFVFRSVIARPIGASPAGTALRRVTIAACISVAVALVAVPVYAIVTTARFTTLSPLDVKELVPLVRVSSFGRAISDLEVLVALFAVAAGVALWLDRPERPQRSVVELLALGSALACASAALLIFGLAGHPAQTSPRALALGVDWAHLAAGSLWLGGLAGLLVLWASAGAGGRAAALAAVVPRFSRVALGSVLALVATGAVAAITHLPTLAALWETGYGRSILVKLGLLAAALVLGVVNLLVTTPRLTAAGLRGDDAFGGHAAALLRRTVTGEITLVASTVFAAGVLTSLPPPAAALSKAGDAVARVGPGPVSRSVVQHDTRVVVTLTPNRAVWPTTLGVALTRRGVPVAGASVIARFDMLDMDMGQRAYVLKERTPGTYQRSAVALLMVGTWGVTFEVTPKAGRPFSFLVVDKANG